MVVIFVVDVVEQMELTTILYLICAEKDRNFLLPPMSKQNSFAPDTINGTNYAISSCLIFTHGCISRTSILHHLILELAHFVYKVSLDYVWL